MVAGLTDRQAQVLDFIRAALARTGMPPTRAEIAVGLGFRSANAAEEHLRALARKGQIELLPGASRGIRVRGMSGAYELALPVVGRVAAGQPLLAVEHIEDHKMVAPDTFKPRADYLLRVRGQSMYDIGIRDGDLLAVHATPTISNGQIAVVRIDDEVTVKRYRRRGSKVLLVAENIDYPPLEIDLKVHELVIEGLAVGVLRTAV